MTFAIRRLTAESRFGSSVAHLARPIAFQVLNLSLGIPSGILAARLLGPEARGLLALFIGSSFLLSTTLGGCLDQALPFLAKQGRPAPTTVGTATLIELGLGLAAGALSLVATAIPAGQSWAVRQALAVQPFFALACLAHATSHAVSVGVLAYRGATAYLRIETVRLTAYFLGLVVFLLVLSGGLTGALSAFMLGLAAQLATGFVLLRHVAVGLRWDGQVAATQWWFGVRSLPGRLSEFLFTGGGDAVVMSLALGAGDVGLYVVARSVLELTLLPAIAAALVIQGGAPFGSAPRTRHLVIGAGILTALGATVLAVAGPALIPFVFGREFIGSAAVLRVLIGAVPALFLIRVLVAWNAREGHPQRNSIAIGSGVPAELVLVPLAGKAFGLTGAALAFAAILWIQAGILVALHQGGRSRRVVPTPG